MASENTHIFLADRIGRRLSNEAVQKIIFDYMDLYFIGSIFPDILFYSKDSRAGDIASGLHGEDGQPTNRIVFNLLDRAKAEKDLQNFAFIAGFLTHYAVDMTFHPIVFYFSGHDPHAKCIDDDQSAYLHMHYETSIDQRINGRFYLDKIICPAALKYLNIYPLLGIDQAAVDKALRRQMKYYGLTRSRLYFHFFRTLSKLGFFPVRAIAGFHANLIRDTTRLPEPILYRDVVTGESKKTALGELTDEAVHLGDRMVECAYAYFTDQINRDEAKKVIAGQSLETGRVGKGIADIRFYAERN